MRLSRLTCRALTSLLLIGIPVLGEAAVTVTVKDGNNATVCTPNFRSLAGSCGNKLQFANSGGTAQVVVDDDAKDLVKLTNIKIYATQVISNYTIVIEATGLAAQPAGNQVWYKTAVRGSASQSASFTVSTQVTDTTGTTTYASVPPTPIKPAPINGAFNSAIPPKQVNSAINGTRNITMKLKIIALGQYGSINIGSNFFMIKNQDTPDCDPDSNAGNCSEPKETQDPRSLPPPIEEIIRAAGREACLGIYSPESGCYGIYIK